MPRTETSLLAFNRGILSPRALSRLDMKRTAFSSEIQDNWMPRAYGSMMLRSGRQYLGQTYNNEKTVRVPFIYSLDDVATIDISDSYLTVTVDDQTITRESVSTAITNGTFDSDLSGWTDADESGASSVWASGGYMSLSGTKYNAAIRTQTVSVGAGDVNKRHAVRVTVSYGEVLIRIGSTSGGDEYIAETTLGEGVHSLSFVPTGSFYIRLFGYTQYASLVTSCTVEGSGAMVLPAPWPEATLPLIRWDQSADVVYLWADGYQQRKIERRGKYSWSIVKYSPKDGPFNTPNTGPIGISASGIVGDITLTASKPLFKSSHVGSLFRITSTGQYVTATLSGGDQYSDPIKVTGTGDGRAFGNSISGTWSGTIKIQRSVDEVGSWVDVSSYTANFSGNSFNDGLSNQIVYYRMGFKPSDYSSGTATVILDYAGGSLDGIARIKGVSSSTSATASVIKSLGGTSSSSAWEEGLWSDNGGWPSCGAICEGRLFQAGNDKWNATVSGTYESFDDTQEGDAAPISKSIGQGAVTTINWMLPLQRLAMGADMAEFFIASSSLDEPLSATASSIRSPSTQGSARISAVRVDNSAIFTHRSGNRLFSLTYDNSSLNYASEDLSKIAPELFEAGISKIVVQRQPDTRIHVILNDGTVVVLIYDQLEEVRCFVTYSCAGFIEDAVVLPQNGEDSVEYTVKYTIDGNVVRYKERIALESECVGGVLNKQADSFILYDGSATNTISGLSHLEGEEVIVWADGKDLSPLYYDTGLQKTYTVTGGSITLDAGVTVEKAIVGLPYKAQFKSSKMAEIFSDGTTLGDNKKIDQLSLCFYKTHARGVRFGRDFDNLDNMPLVIGGVTVDEDSIFDALDNEPVSFGGSWGTDSRLCLESMAPRPCTITAAIVKVTTNA